MHTKRLLADFHELVDMVHFDHERQGICGGGHDFYHALIVASYAALIAENVRLATLGFVAGICHNADRMYPHDECPLPPAYLRKTGDELSYSEREAVCEAVMEHSKKNDPNDNPVTVILKDADRLGNIGPLHWLRAGQFRPN